MKRLIVVMLMLIALVAWFIVRTTERVKEKKQNTELVSPAVKDVNTKVS